MGYWVRVGVLLASATRIAFEERKGGRKSRRREEENKQCKKCRKSIGTSGGDDGDAGRCAVWPTLYALPQYVCRVRSFIPDGLPILTCHQPLGVLAGKQPPHMSHCLGDPINVLIGVWIVKSKRLCAEDRSRSRHSIVLFATTRRWFSEQRRRHRSSINIGSCTRCRLCPMMQARPRMQLPST